MNEITELILSNSESFGFSKEMCDKVYKALSSISFDNGSGKDKYLLTFPNKKEIPKSKFADQIFSILSKLDIEKPPTKWKNWFYLVEESYKTEGKHIHVFVWLTYKSINWDGIKRRFTFEIDGTICSPYVTPIGSVNWTSVLLYLTKEDQNPIYSVERQEDIINYFNNLKEKSVETEERKVNLSNVLENMKRNKESTLVKEYFKKNKRLDSEELEEELEEEEERIVSLKTINIENEDHAHKVLQLKTKIFDSQLVVIQTKSDKTISFVLTILRNHFKLQNDPNYRIVEISPHHQKVENEYDRKDTSFVILVFSNFENRKKNNDLRSYLKSYFYRPEGYLNRYSSDRIISLFFDNDSRLLAELLKEDVVKIEVFDEKLNWIDLRKASDKTNFENNIVIHGDININSNNTTNYGLDEDSLLELKKELKKEIKKEILEELFVEKTKVLPIPKGILHTFQTIENVWESLWKPNNKE